MTKALSKAIMKRSELESKHVKNKTSENLKSYKNQRHFCSKLYKKESKKYYERLDLNNITDNKKFWKAVKPFLSDKVTTFPQITLVENDEIISDESRVANSFSNFLENAVHSLCIKTNETTNDNYGLKNLVEIAIKKYEQHPSIDLIKENITNNESFHFLPTEQESILKEIIYLDNQKKNGTFKNIPTRCLKDA